MTLARTLAVIGLVCIILFSQFGMAGGKKAGSDKVKELYDLQNDHLVIDLDKSQFE